MPTPKSSAVQNLGFRSGHPRWVVPKGGYLPCEAYVRGRGLYEVYVSI